MKHLFYKGQLVISQIYQGFVLLVNEIYKVNLKDCVWIIRLFRLIDR